MEIAGEIALPATVLSEAIELVVKNGSIDELAVVLVELNFSSMGIDPFLSAMMGIGFDSINPYF